MKGDLHIHTTISDGSYNIKEVLQLAKEKQLTHISITNHDTVEGLKDAVRLGREMGIKVIPGIEISAYDFKSNKKVHILGYNFKFEPTNIINLCRPTLKARDENSRWQIQELIKNGYDIEIGLVEEKCKEGQVIYKQHIMDVLKDRDYTGSIYSELYRRLFKNNGMCARDINYVDAIEAVKAIKSDKGIAVLAHPGQLDSFDLIPDLVLNGLDGLEINHPSHSDEDMVKIMEFSEIYGLILTGGSDFHGVYSEGNATVGDVECPIETLNIF